MLTQDLWSLCVCRSEVVVQLCGLAPLMNRCQHPVGKQPWLGLAFGLLCMWPVSYLLCVQAPTLRDSLTGKPSRLSKFCNQNDAACRP